MMIGLPHDMSLQKQITISFLNKHWYLCRDWLSIGIASGKESKGMIINELKQHLFILLFEVRKIIHSAKIAKEFMTFRLNLGEWHQM